MTQAAFQIAGVQAGHRISTYEPHERIASAYVRNEFMWDRMGDVRWDVVKGSLRAAENVLQNPEKFPRADFDALEERAEKLGDFLCLHALDWRVASA